MANTLGGRLEGYRLSMLSGTLYRIKNFLTIYQELDEIPNEGWSESHALSMFLKEIIDLVLETFITIQRSKNKILEEAVLALRKLERELNKKRVKKRKLRTTVCRMIKNNEIKIDYGDDSGSYGLTKRVRKFKESGGEIDARITKDRYISVNKGEFRKLSTDDWSFV
eukprot:7985880-Ditylum_brightwellii.AAC.1